MMGESVTLWEVFTVVVLPISLAAVALLWRRVEKVDDELASHKAEIAKWQLTAVSNFISKSDLSDLRKEILAHLQRIENRLQAIGGHGHAGGEQ